MDEDEIDTRIQDILAEAGWPDGSTFLFRGRVGTISQQEIARMLDDIESLPETD